MATSMTWWVTRSKWIANKLLMIKIIIFDVSFSPYRLSALMVDGWLPWQWIALFAHGISPPGGKSAAILQRLSYGKQLDFVLIQL